jgi:hypothetical protein
LARVTLALCFIRLDGIVGTGKEDKILKNEGYQLNLFFISWPTLRQRNLTKDKSEVTVIIQRTFELGRPGSSGTPLLQQCRMP